MLVHQFLESNAEVHSYREAVVHLGSRINYMELERNANRLANFLIKSGVKKHLSPYSKNKYNKNVTNLHDKSPIK